jgi:hypothetical protein
MPSSTAGRATETYDLLMGPKANVGKAPNGDTVEVTCTELGGACGTFSVFPKSLPTPPSGEFLHKDAAGNVLGGGTWTATKLLDYQSYGCGEVTSEGLDLPDNFCGGKLKFRAQLDTAAGQFSGILTVFCIVGPKAPSNHDEPPEEGVTLDIPGVINFNKVGGGENVYVRQD